MAVAGGPAGACPGPDRRRPGQALAGGRSGVAAVCRAVCPRPGRATGMNEFVETLLGLEWHEPKSSYDVVIIGAGGHGLATAYYLATRHGITNVAVVEASYIGSGNSLSLIHI